MADKSENQLKMYSFRVDDETDTMITDLAGLVGEGVVANRRRSIAIREAIRTAWKASCGPSSPKKRK